MRPVVVVPWWLYMLGLSVGVAIVGSIAVIALFVAAVVFAALIVACVLAVIADFALRRRPINLPQRRQPIDPDPLGDEDRARRDLYPMTGLHEAARDEAATGIVHAWPRHASAADTALSPDPAQEVLFP